MWKVWFREYGLNGKLLFEGILTKEYKDKGNASKLMKKFSITHPEFKVGVGIKNPFEN